jgi:hypothetical protein
MDQEPENKQTLGPNGVPRAVRPLAQGGRLRAPDSKAGPAVEGLP